ncbi:unnamed protein product [Euphydryas editha]|uniref:FP protein C-terminal domain-containing protein n=1 Tax=Euphydryas editha TaxID=104508 RepID=A0AAU9UX19_EUPED|nr:unnamed protein product [Euphydryas editha]
MANKCNQCGKFVSSADSAKCVKCTSLLHRTGTEFEYDNELFDETFLDANPENNNSVTLLAQQITLLRVDLVSVSREMSSFRQDLAVLNTNVTEFNKRVDKIEMRISTLEEKCLTANKEVSDSRSNEIINQLRQELNDREQENLFNEISITGVPETNGENLTHITCLISKTLGVELQPNDVVNAERLGIRRGSEDKTHPRTLTMRLTRRALGDELLKAACVRRNIDTVGILDEDPHKLYVNERLTRRNYKLFQKARELDRKNSWHYIWTRNGRIYARQYTGAPAQRIQMEQGLAIFDSYTYKD